MANAKRALFGLIGFANFIYYFLQQE